MLIFGWRNPAPLPLAAQGMPGCSLNVSIDAVTLVTGSGGIAVHRLPIPNLLSLVGRHFFHQVFVLDPASGNAIGAVMSDAAEGVVGR